MPYTHSFIGAYTFVGRPPSSDRAFAITALIFYTLFAGIAFLLEKRRSAPDGH
jgi:hypothetical protein